MSDDGTQTFVRVIDRMHADPSGRHRLRNIRNAGADPRNILKFIFETGVGKRRI